MRLLPFRLKILLFIILFFPFLYLFFLLSPTSFSSEKIRFVILPEEKQEMIVKRLKRENFIRSEKAFQFMAGLIKFPGQIEPGAYLLSRNLNLIQIADILLNHPYQKWIVLVPGLRVEQIAEKLKEKFNWSEEKTQEFLSHAKEGYMFPDTYLFNLDYSGREFAQKMIDNFNEKFEAKIQADLLAQNIKNDTAIKIASLIERESGEDSDKALIAGIIWNRLLKGMRLEIDATVQYALGKPGNWWPDIRGRNLREINSPFNTYIIKGLPPAPIANPSFASIKAVVYPAQTDCLFYLHAPDKQIYCSKTYEEHKENIKKYLR